MKALFVAVDGGPREALAPVAAQCGSALIDIAADAAETDAHWAAVVASERPDLLVVGTSDGARGRLVESAARRAARKARVPIAAIEDFPGNYCDVAAGEASLVLVESAAARAVLLDRAGNRPPRVEVAIPARYDRFRARLGELRRKTAACWAEPGKPKVLWAGQPETEDAVRTLHALLPILREHDVELLFKAHPRDAGYADGAYRALLTGSEISVRDLTQASAEVALAAGPRLIVTQFSSIAIEGGFFGVPSLWVLLACAGSARLQQKKGYAVPPVCLAQGAACVMDERALAEAFGRALADIGYRENLMCCFDDYYRVDRLGAAEGMSLLLAAAGSK